MQLELGAVTSGNSVAECAASGARFQIEKGAVHVTIGASAKFPLDQPTNFDYNALADAGRPADSGAISASPAAAGAA